MLYCVGMGPIKSHLCGGTSRCTILGIYRSVRNIVRMDVHMHGKLLIGDRNYTWASSGIFYYLISKLIGKLIVAL